MEIRILRKELQQEYANLLNADYNSIEYLLDDFISFVNQNKKLSELIESIPAYDFELEQWVSELNTKGTAGFPKDKAKRIKFFMDLIQWVEGDVYKVSRSFSHGSKLNDHINAFVEYFVLPIYQYLDAVLLREEMESEPISNTHIKDSNVVIINGANFGSISQNSHQVIRDLSELSEKITSEESLSQQEKLNSIANIDTLKAQLLNEKPNREILKLSRDAILSAATTAGAEHLLSSIEKMLDEE